MYAIASHNDATYQPLADTTWDKNKVPYCQQHGYVYYNRTQDFDTARPGMAMTQYEKIYVALDMLEAVPDISWLWWLGTDTMITNFSIKIEHRIDNDYDFMICVDNNGLNACSFLVKNSQAGKNILKAVIADQPNGLRHWDQEQWSISNMLGFPGTSDPRWPRGEHIQVTTAYRSQVKLLPQRYMNSFDYSLYHYNSDCDRLGNSGQWQSGDWLVHWPGTDLATRLRMASKYLDLVVQ